MGKKWIMHSEGVNKILSVQEWGIILIKIDRARQSGTPSVGTEKIAEDQEENIDSTCTSSGEDCSFAAKSNIHRPVPFKSRTASKGVGCFSTRPQVESGQAIHC